MLLCALGQMMFKFSSESLKKCYCWLVFLVYLFNVDQKIGQIKLPSAHAHRGDHNQSITDAYILLSNG